MEGRTKGDTNCVSEFARCTAGAVYTAERAGSDNTIKSRFLRASDGGGITEFDGTVRDGFEDGLGQFEDNLRQFADALGL